MTSSTPHHHQTKNYPPIPPNCRLLQLHPIQLRFPPNKHFTFCTNAVIQTLVRLGDVLGLLQLHLEALRADLKAVHSLDGRIRRRGRVKGHEPKALGQIRLLVDEDLRGDHGAKGRERGGEILVGELLRQVVDEQVAAVGTWKHTR